ncbi:conserved hypothetical protein [Trichinella spiralis]|uniref:hypothetical protein n=1 Tax=Trichinella spiralis TaxID=6334 RepID=UPI0001EFB979|nr:conserved hypothetical protein [Trichinella spiralis]
MKGKQLLVPGWDNLKRPIPTSAVTLSQQPHTSFRGKNSYHSLLIYFRLALCPAAFYFLLHSVLLAHSSISNTGIHFRVHFLFIADQSRKPYPSQLQQANFR